MQQEQMLTPTLMMFVSFLEAQDFPLLLEPKDLSSIQKITSGLYLGFVQVFFFYYKSSPKNSSTCGLCIETLESFSNNEDMMVTKISLNKWLHAVSKFMALFLLSNFSIVGELFWIKSWILKDLPYLFGYKPRPQTLNV